MSNPTSNFNWQMPTNTDLVTDLPADFEVFGQAVDTSMADLKGGTTGQILSKATNTDMDFTWITNVVGDITAVTATSPLTGGGTSGAVTVGIQDASTSQKGSVQLSDSTSTTSSVLASTPTATKSAYDLAAAAVPKSTVTTAGDVIYATGSGVVTRLGIGTAGQVLTVNGGATAPSWAAASGGKTLITSTSMSGSASVTFASIPTTYKDLVIQIKGYYQSAAGRLKWQGNTDSTATNYDYSIGQYRGNFVQYVANSNYLSEYQISTTNGNNYTYLYIPDYLNTSAYKQVQIYENFLADNGTRCIGNGMSQWLNTAAINQIIISSISATNFSAGTCELYGIK
jgi:hypothetical protein